MKNNSLIDMIVQSDHIQIDNLVGSDQRVQNHESGIADLMAAVKSKCVDEFDTRDLEEKILAIATAHADAGFRVGISYGLRIAREINELVAATEEV